MRKIYEHLLVGHPEVGRTTELVARNYYFSRIIRITQKIM